MEIHSGRYRMSRTWPPSPWPWLVTPISITVATPFRPPSNPLFLIPWFSQSSQQGPFHSLPLSPAQVISVRGAPQSPTPAHNAPTVRTLPAPPLPSSKPSLTSPGQGLPCPTSDSRQPSCPPLHMWSSRNPVTCPGARRCKQPGFTSPQGTLSNTLSGAGRSVGGQAGGTTGYQT